MPRGIPNDEAKRALWDALDPCDRWLLQFLQARDLAWVTDKPAAYRDLVREGLASHELADVEGGGRVDAVADTVKGARLVAFAQQQKLADTEEWAA